MKGVVIASSDRLWMEAAVVYLERAGWRVAGTAADGLAALGLISSGPPRALLVADGLARLGASALAQHVRTRWPTVTVVIVGQVRSVHAHVVAADAGGGAVLAALERPLGEAAPTSGEERQNGLRLLASLTARERTILRLLATGFSQEEIAMRLGVRGNTVRTHMQNLYAKLGRHSRLEVVQFALTHGVVTRSD